MVIKSWQAIVVGGAILVLSAVAGRAQDLPDTTDAAAGGDGGFCETCGGAEIGGPVDTSQPEVEPPEPGTNVVDPNFVPDGKPGEWAPETVSPPDPGTGGPEAGFIPDGNAGEWATGVLQPDAPDAGGAVYQSWSESGGEGCSKHQLLAGKCS